MVGDLATVVQRKLTVLGYEDVPQNGKFDTATRNAVRDFQTNSGLPATGEMDSQTLKLLNSMSFIR
jgi:peptidoglycan hydrolase-like protein with peptidoglycan-binding domain